MYAAAQLLLAMPTLVLFVLAGLGGALVLVVVGIPLLLCWSRRRRWLADRHRVMAGRVLGTPLPAAYREPPGGPLLRLASAAARPDDLARPGLAAGRRHHRLRALAARGPAARAGRTGALWWFGAEPIMRARAALDRFLLSYGHTERLEQRVQVLTETRADPSTTRPPSCAGSSATCTTAPRPGWWRSG